MNHLKNYIIMKVINLYIYILKLYLMLLYFPTAAGLSHIILNNKLLIINFALRQISEKTIEYNCDLYLVFVDQEKAFDRVNRDKLWQALEQYDINNNVMYCQVW